VSLSYHSITSFLLIIPDAHHLSPVVCFGTQEIHIMHLFNSDFYGHEMKAIVLGYIRPELDYTSRGAHR